MKHVFYLHSATCIEMFEAIIDFKKINEKDIVIFNARSLKGLTNKYLEIFISESLDLFPFYTHKQIFNFKWIKSNLIIKNWDRLIDLNIDEEFTFYSQNGRHYKYNVIMTNSLCKHVNYFEDGIDFYFTKNQFNRKYPSPLFLRYKIINFILGKLMGNYARIKQYDNVFRSLSKNDGIFFGLHKNSGSNFKNYFKKRIILNYDNSYTNHSFNKNDVIFCFSALEEQLITSNKSMIESYICWINKNKISKINLFLRFHPAQTENTKKFIIDKLTMSKYKFKVIPDEIRMESIFRSKDFSAIVVGCGSSLLMYALLMSNKSIVNVIYPIIEAKVGKTFRSNQWKDSFEKIKNKRLKIWK